MRFRSRDAHWERRFLWPVPWTGFATTPKPSCSVVGEMRSEEVIEEPCQRACAVVNLLEFWTRALCGSSMVLEQRAWASSPPAVAQEMHRHLGAALAGRELVSPWALVKVQLEESFLS